MTKFEVGTKVMDLDYNIKQTIETEGTIIVLLEIPFSENELNNIYSFNKNGDLNWRVNVNFNEYAIINRLPFEMISIIDGFLYASDFYGRRFKIDIETGLSLNYDVVR